jgi:hypothetical protein
MHVINAQGIRQFATYGLSFAVYVTTKPRILAQLLLIITE